MKKRFIALFTAVLLAAAPIYVQADEKDDKIVELEPKVNDLKKRNSRTQRKTFQIRNKVWN